VCVHPQTQHHIGFYHLGVTVNPHVESKRREREGERREKERERERERERGQR
jgi:hypothetical protein